MHCAYYTLMYIVPMRTKRNFIVFGHGNEKWHLSLILLLVAHSATQYSGLCVCVTTFQINSSVLPNAFFELIMACKGFQMVPEGSMSKHP